jgi:hypothetical protein
LLERENAVKKMTKGRPIGERFAPLVWSIIDSAEFSDLSNVATRILVKLLRLHDGYNNGNIALGSREAARWAHCSQRTACRALSELVSARFITVVSKGHFVPQGVGKNIATRWRLNCVGKIE